VSDPFEHLAKRHPCLGGGPAVSSGRVHLPVSPECNIGCRFCTRGLGSPRDGEERPGTARRLLFPEEAPAFVEHALELCPGIAVVGIAGPGDTLATDHAERTFALVHSRFPGLIKCLSTNGLRLEERLPALLAAGVSTVTVTVNGVDPETVGAIVSMVKTERGILRGSEGARVLIERQMAGIRAAARSGLVVKVNQVLVPGVNDSSVGETARAVRDAGARMFNLIPLIPQGGFADVAAPDCVALQRAREEAEASLPVFRHCRHCRADACGLLNGPDLSGELYRDIRIEETFSHG